MEVTIAKDQPMEYLPRVKSIFKEGVYRYDFMVKCRPQNVITTEEENPAVKSIIRKLGALSGYGVQIIFFSLISSTHCKNHQIF